MYFLTRRRQQQTSLYPPPSLLPNIDDWCPIIHPNSYHCEIFNDVFPVLHGLLCVACVQRNVMLQIWLIWDSMDVMCNAVPKRATSFNGNKCFFAFSSLRRCLLWFLLLLPLYSPKSIIYYLLLKFVFLFTL